MRFFLSFALLTIFACGSVLAQQSPVRVLKDNFGGEDGVVSASSSGIFARTILKLAAEKEFRTAIKKVKRIRLILVPQQTITDKRYDFVNFKNQLTAGDFDQLMAFKEDADNISIYVKEVKKKRHNRYFLMIDNRDELIAIEIKGLIDTNLLLNNSNYSVQK